MNKDLALLHFQAGQFQMVLETIESHPELRQKVEIFPIWIGSLVFTGDLPKAEALFRKYNPKNSGLIAARFFLSIGLTRQSRYKEARHLIAKNLRSLNKHSRANDHFYIYQGLAFYRFFCGRYSLSKKYAEKSYNAAVECENVFGELISKDLWAHSLIHVGQILKGLKFFEETIKSARRVKNQWLTAACQISLLKFRAQFGIHPKTDLIDLENALSQLAPQDTYSMAELLLELNRQYLLRGQFQKAESALSQASDLIYKHQNRRQLALLNLRMSHMLYLQTQHHQALHILRFSEQNIDPHVDLGLWTQLMGLKIQILRALHRNDEATTERTALLLGTQRSQNAINKRILRRHTQPQNNLAPDSAEDRIGDLLDKASKQDPSTPRLITETGYYGLLHKFYRVPYGSQCLVFDLIPGSVIVLDKGNVLFKKKGFNSLLRKIILLLKEQPQSKENLVRQIWGYEYDPLRHDPLIYSSINKIRKLLEPYSDWVTLTEEGYSIRSDVRVIIKNVLKVSARAKMIQSPHLQMAKPLKKMSQHISPQFKDLNFRQIQIVDYLKSHPSISIFELATKLDISKPTATRDLSSMHKLGILKRVGKGRATRYLI